MIFLFDSRVITCVVYRKLAFVCPRCDSLFEKRLRRILFLLLSSPSSLSSSSLSSLFFLCCTLLILPGASRETLNDHDGCPNKDLNRWLEIEFNGRASRTRLARVYTSPGDRFVKFQISNFMSRTAYTGQLGGEFFRVANVVDAFLMGKRGSGRVTSARIGSISGGCFQPVNLET